MSILFFILVVGSSLGNPKFVLIETEDVTGFDAGYEEPQYPKTNTIKPDTNADYNWSRILATMIKKIFKGK